MSTHLFNNVWSASPPPSCKKIPRSACKRPPSSIGNSGLWKRVALTIQSESGVVVISTCSGLLAAHELTGLILLLPL